MRGEHRVPGVSEPRWTKEQPKDGDTVLHCGHLEGPTTHHFFKLTGEASDGSAKFKWPDGTWDKARWMSLCDSCFEIHAQDPGGARIRGAATWEGDAPGVWDDTQ